ncbi:MAG: hypothetical protein RR355_00145, partial [Oscillospiraceae bacterium]
MLPNALVKYSEIVRSGKVAVCKFQTLLIDYIENCFNEETLNLDEEQFEKYMSYQQYFPFKLFEWEKFVFALHNCVYRTDGFLRWPTLFLYLGRGSGKNGYLSFEDFCLLTPTNGIKNYHIDIYAVAEANAKTSFEEIYNVLENNEQKMKRFFKWNLEEIENLFKALDILDEDEIKALEFQRAKVKNPENLYVNKLIHQVKKKGFI